MTGGLLQLISYGSADLTLTGSPQITFFKAVYRSYAPFSIEDIDIPFYGKINYNSVANVTLPVNGDLIHKMKLKINLPSVSMKYKYTPQEEINLLLQKNNTYLFNNTIYNYNLIRLKAIQNYLSNYFPKYLIWLNSTSYTDFLITQYNVPFFDIINLEASTSRIIGETINYNVPITNNNLTYILDQQQFNNDSNNNLFKYNTGNEVSLQYIKNYNNPDIYLNIELNANITTWDTYFPYNANINNLLLYTINVSINNNSDIITSTGLFDPSILNNYITGEGIPDGSYVNSYIDVNTITINKLCTNTSNITANILLFNNSIQISIQSGSNIITSKGLFTPKLLGTKIQADGIDEGEIIIAFIDENQLLISNPALTTNTIYAKFTYFINNNVDIQNGNTIITDINGNFYQGLVGSSISGFGIPDNTFIDSFINNQVVSISNPATDNVTTVSTFSFDITTNWLSDYINPFSGNRYISTNNRSCYIYKTSNNSYLKLCKLIMNSYSVSNNITTIKCFVSEISNNFTIDDIINVQNIFSNVDINNIPNYVPINASLIPLNIANIISINIDSNINFLKNSVGYLGTYNDPYNSIVSYLLSESFYNNQLSATVFTGNKFKRFTYSLTVNSIFKRVHNFIINDNLSSWNINLTNPTTPFLFIDYQLPVSNIGKKYPLLFLYTLDNNIYNQFGYGIILNINYQGFNTLIDMAFLVGRSDFIDPTLSTADIYISTIGNTDINNFINQDITAFVPPNIHIVNNYTITENSEAYIYDRIDKTNLNINTLTQLEKTQYTPRIIELVFSENLTNWFNNLNIYNNADFNSLPLFQTSIYSIDSNINTTILNVFTVLEPTFNIDQLSNGSYIGYSRSGINFNAVINGFTIDNITLNYNNTGNTRYDFTFTINQNITNWFITSFILFITQTGLISLTTSDAVLRINNIIASGNTSNVLCQYVVSDNESLIEINNVKVNYYAYNRNNTSQFSQIRAVNFIQYDNFMTYQYVFNNNTTNNDTDFKTLVENSMQNSMISNPTIVRNIFTQLYQNVNYSFRAFDSSGGNLDGINNEFFNTDNLNNMLQSFLTNVFNPPPNFYQNGTNYLTPYINLINQQNNLYRSYNLLSLNNVVTEVIANTNYNIAKSIAQIIKFYKGSNILNDPESFGNPNAHIIFVINQDLTFWGPLLNVGQTLNIRLTNTLTPILAKVIINSVSIFGNQTTIDCFLSSAPISLSNILPSYYIFSFDDSLNAPILSTDTFYNNYTNRLTNYQNTTIQPTNSTWFINYLLLNYATDSFTELINYNTKINNVPKYLFNSDATLFQLIDSITFNNNYFITINTNLFTNWNTYLNVGDIIQIRQIQDIGNYIIAELTIINTIYTSNTVIECSLNLNNTIIKQIDYIPKFVFQDIPTHPVLPIRNIYYNYLDIDIQITLVIDQNLQNTTWFNYLIPNNLLFIQETNTFNTNVASQFPTLKILTVNYSYWSTTINTLVISGDQITIPKAFYTYDYLLPYNNAISQFCDFITINNSNIDLEFYSNIENKYVEFIPNDIYYLQYSGDILDTKRVNSILNTAYCYSYYAYIYDNSNISGGNLIGNVRSINIINPINVEIVFFEQIDQNILLLLDAGITQIIIREVSNNGNITKGIFTINIAGINTSLTVLNCSIGFTNEAINSNNLVVSSIIQNVISINKWLYTQSNDLTNYPPIHIIDQFSPNNLIIVNNDTIIINIPFDVSIINISNNILNSWIPLLLLGNVLYIRETPNPNSQILATLNILSYSIIPNTSTQIITRIKQNDYRYILDPFIVLFNDNDTIATSPLSIYLDPTDMTNSTVIINTQSPLLLSINDKIKFRKSFDVNTQIISNMVVISVAGTQIRAKLHLVLWNNNTSTFTNLDAVLPLIPSSDNTVILYLNAAIVNIGDTVQILTNYQLPTQPLIPPFIPPITNIMELTITDVNGTIASGIITQTNELPYNEFSNYSNINLSLLNTNRILQQLETNDRYLFNYDQTLNNIIQSITINNQNEIQIIINNDLSIPWTTYLDYRQIIFIKYTNILLDPIISSFIITNVIYNTNTTIYCRLISPSSSISDTVIYDKYMYSINNDINILINDISYIDSENITLVVNSNLSTTSWNNYLIYANELYIRKTNNYNDPIYFTLLIKDTIYAIGSTTILCRLMIPNDPTYNLQTDIVNYNYFTTKKFIKIYDYLYKFFNKLENDFNLSPPTGLPIDYPNVNKLYIANITKYSNLYNTDGILNEINKYDQSIIPNINTILRNIIVGSTINNIGFNNQLVNNLSLTMITGLLIQNIQSIINNTNYNSNYPLMNELTTDATTYFTYINNIIDTPFTVGYTTWNLFNEIIFDDNIFLLQNETLNFTSVQTFPYQIQNIATINTNLINLLTDIDNGLTYYFQNRNLLNILNINYNTINTYSPDATIIQNSLINTVQTTLKNVKLIFFPNIPTILLWTPVLIIGSIINVRQTINLLDPILCSIIITNVITNIVDQYVIITGIVSSFSGDINDDIINGYYASVQGNEAIFNTPIQQNDIIYNYNPTYEIINDTQKYIFNNAITSAFNPTFKNLTITAINNILTDKFKSYYNDWIIMQIFNNSLPIDPYNLIQTTNIIRTLETTISNIPLAPDDVKTQVLQTTGKQLLQEYIPNYNINYVYYKNCILSQSEYNELYPIVSLIDSLNGSDLVIYNDINFIYSNIPAIVFTIFRSYLPIPNTFTETNNENPEPYNPLEIVRNISDNNTNILLSDFIKTYKLITNPLPPNFNNPFNNDSNTFILYRNCIITPIEANFIYTSPNPYPFNLPNTLVPDSIMPLTQTIHRVFILNDPSYDSGYRLYQNCIVTVAEETQLLFNILPNSLTYVDGLLVRKTDIPYGFTYDRNTSILTRTLIFDDYLNSVIQTSYFSKSLLSITQSYFDNRLYNAIYACLVSGRINIKNTIQIFNQKIISLLNIINSYNSAYFYSNESFIDDQFFVSDIIQTILQNIYLDLFGKVNVDPQFNTPQLTNDYITQTIDINKLIPVNTINDIFIIKEQITENTDIMLSTLLTQYNTYISLLPQINAINNRTSDYANFCWTKRLGHFIIDKMELFIGDQLINTLYGDWINIWYELNHKVAQERGYNIMIGNTDELTTFNNKVKPRTDLFIELPFWFSRNNTLALPIVALLNTDIKIRWKIPDINKIAQIEDNTYFVKFPQLRASLMTQYIYLDNDERKKFAESKHEYLIEEIQYNGGVRINKPNNIIPLKFYNPCKDLVWVVQLYQHIDGSYDNKERQWYNYSTVKAINGFVPNDTNTVNIAQIKLNSMERFKAISGTYFNIVQPFELYNNTPYEGINTYSFGLQPLSLQPTGQCNFSFIDNSILDLQLNDVISKTNQAEVRVYARSYNILRIFGGQAGLAFYGGNINK